MAKAILTFEDKDDGDVGVTLEFDPPALTKENATPAQFTALRAIQLVAGVEDEEADDLELDDEDYPEGHPDF